MGALQLCNHFKALNLYSLRRTSRQSSLRRAKLVHDEGGSRSIRSNAIIPSSVSIDRAELAREIASNFRHRSAASSDTKQSPEFPRLTDRWGELIPNTLGERTKSFASWLVSTNASPSVNVCRVDPELLGLTTGGNTMER